MATHPDLRRVASVLLLTGIIGCSSSGTEQDSEPSGIDTLTFSIDTTWQAINFIKETAFKPPENISFHANDDISAGDSGIVFIKEGVNIHVYNKEGDHITTMGGEGRGPGEHNRMGQNEMQVQANHLYTYDDILNRINVFSLKNYEPVNTISMDESSEIDGSYPGFTVNKPFYHAFADSLLLVRFNKPSAFAGENPVREEYKIQKIPSSYYLMNREGNIVSDKIIQIDYYRRLTPILSGFPPLPVQNGSLFSVSPEGYLFLRRNRRFFHKSI